MGKLLVASEYTEPSFFSKELIRDLANRLVKLLERNLVV